MHPMINVKTKREEMGLTQQELADKTNLSLRTIQRVESGATTPKGYTLRALAEVFEVEPSQLVSEPSLADIDVILQNIKLINLSALSLLIVPFGNLIFPFIVWRKNKELDPIVDDAGRQIINFQILWSFGFYLLLVLSPFIQHFLGITIPLILIVLIIGIGINLYFIARTANCINNKNFKIFNPPLNLF